MSLTIGPESNIFTLCHIWLTPEKYQREEEDVELQLETDICAHETGGYESHIEITMQNLTNLKKFNGFQLT